MSGLQWWVDLVITVVVKVPSHVSTGQSRQRRRCIPQPSVAVGLNKLFSWQCCQDSAEEEVPESQTLPKRLTNILGFVGLLKLAFGEGSKVSKLHKRHVGMGGIHVTQASRLPGSNTCSGKGPSCLKF